MAVVIDDEMIDYVGILAKLSLNEEERERAKHDMTEMLDYIDKLSELDTDNVEPMSHLSESVNVFREDVITNPDYHEETLSNAPERNEDYLVVPKTI
ncbi:MAG: Asp-tRNA(Asn)/Glu-tRNA(Gln) amidotransferase subunit GatC [Lachnospiraceae bacterium]|nr:Asp-tRNA(Asn)/Glu-tRNA(Gln) amidotransferase subunit GatC [Lachnospiraceae bacterium]